MDITFTTQAEASRAKQDAQAIELIETFREKEILHQGFNRTWTGVIYTCEIWKTSGVYQFQDTENGTETTHASQYVVIQHHHSPHVRARMASKRVRPTIMFDRAGPI